MVEVLGTGTTIPEIEGSSAIGSTIAGVIAILRQIVEHAYGIAVWLLKQLSENPFGAITLALNTAIIIL